MELSNLNHEMDDLHITSHVVLDNLPALLKDCLSVAKTTSSRDMLLMSMLTSTSSVMNNVSFRYAHYGKRYYPNLLTFIMAGAASGKGVAQLALQLVQPIHDEQPLLIPGDSTYPAFFDRLLDQQGVGLLFETEGSVITDVWRSSCTSYNTALRKAAEHETLSKSRVQTGTEEILSPKMSALLTGTYGQFLALVPNVENGFFSRLNLLVVRDQMPFDGTVFMPSDAALQTERVFGYWAHQLQLWHAAQNHPVEFRLTERQALQIGVVMEGEYGEYLRQLGEGFHASIVRNGITLMRIACILSVLRLIGSDTTMYPAEPAVLTCTDQDFDTAMLIATKLLLNAADAYTQIDAHSQPIIPQQHGHYERDTFLAVLPMSFTTGQCVEMALRMGICERTVRRWLGGWCEEGHLIKTAHGEYEKSVA